MESSHTYHSVRLCPLRTHTTCIFPRRVLLFGWHTLNNLVFLFDYEICMFHNMRHKVQRAPHSLIRPQIKQIECQYYRFRCSAHVFQLMPNLLNLLFEHTTTTSLKPLCYDMLESLLNHYALLSSVGNAVLVSKF